MDVSDWLLCMSKGSVVMRIRCGGNFSDYGTFITGFLQSVSVKEF